MDCRPIFITIIFCGQLAFSSHYKSKFERSFDIKGVLKKGSINYPSFARVTLHDGSFCGSSYGLILRGRPVVKMDRIKSHQDQL